MCAQAQQDPTDIESRLSAIQDLQSPPSIFVDRDPSFSLLSNIERSGETPAYNPQAAGQCKTVAVNPTAPADHYSSKPKDLTGKKSTWTGIGSLAAAPSTNPGQFQESRADTTLTPSLTLAWVIRSDTGHCYLNNERTDGAFDPHWTFTTRVDANAIDALDDETSDVSGATLTASYSMRLGTARTTSQKFKTRLILEAKNSVAYGDLYKDWASTSYSGAVKLSHFLFENKTGNAKIDGSVGYLRSNPKTSSYGYVTAEVSRKFTNVFGNSAWSATAKASANYRDYNEATTSREDVNYAGGVTFARKFSDGAEFNIGLTAASRDSSDNLRDYEALSLPLTFGVTRPF